MDNASTPPPGLPNTNDAAWTIDAITMDVFSVAAVPPTSFSKANEPSRPTLVIVMDAFSKAIVGSHFLPGPAGSEPET